MNARPRVSPSPVTISPPRQERQEVDKRQSGVPSLSHQVYLRRMRMMIKLNRTSVPREDIIHPFCRWKVILTATTSNSDVIDQTV